MQVIFLGEVAVVEKNGQPHRVYFASHKRNVLIDGNSFSLRFGKTHTYYIDGNAYKFRFGSPSRELYINNSWMTGSFGGNIPIVVKIDGIRHEILLCGPPPVVLIEHDPCSNLCIQLQTYRLQQLDLNHHLSMLPISTTTPSTSTSTTTEEVSPLVNEWDFQSHFSDNS